MPIEDEDDRVSDEEMDSARSAAELIAAGELTPEEAAMIDAKTDRDLDEYFGETVDETAARIVALIRHRNEVGLDRQDPASIEASAHPDDEFPGPDTQDEIAEDEIEDDDDEIDDEDDDDDDEDDTE